MRQDIAELVHNWKVRHAEKPGVIHVGQLNSTAEGRSRRSAF